MNIALYHDIPGTTAHSRLTQHLQRYEYKRGHYKGDAPADETRRNMSHFRVAKRGDCMAVVFHRCDILTALPDGSVVLRADGWENAPTTRAALNGALSLAGYRGWLQTRNENGYKNTALHILCKPEWRSFAWCEALTIHADGRVDNYGKKFKAYRSDREARKEWAAQPNVQEFKALLPILLANALFVSSYRRRYDLSTEITTITKSRDLIEGALDTPEAWGLLAEYLRCDHEDPKAAWKWVQAHCTREMTQLVELED